MENSRMIGQRTMGILYIQVAQKWKEHLKTILRRILTVCISLLCYNTMSKLLLSIVRDTGNNPLVK